jgi:hypothetical protein
MDVRESIMQELRGLPEDRLSAVLEYVRFLRLRALSDNDIDRQFDTALATARAIAQHEDITEADVEREISKVRASK